MRVPLALAAASGLAAAALVGVAVTPGHHAVQETAATAYTVTLRAAGGHFVSAAYGGGAAVAANQRQAASWETFTLSDANGGSLASGDQVSLRTSNGHYLSAQWGGGAGVDADYTHHLSWETFRLTVPGAGAGTRVASGATVALETTVRLRYVGASPTAGGAITATATSVGTTERFTLGLSAAPAPAPTATARPAPTPAPTAPATARPTAVPTTAPTTPAPAPTATAAPPAAGFVYPEPGQRTGTGTLPVAAAGTQYLGTQQTDRTIVRDLGFSGVVNGQSVWTFGDTLVPNSGPYDFAASDSVALGQDRAHPTVVHDRNVNADGRPQEWIPLTAAEQANGGLGRYAEGGTNVVEYAPGKGLVWYLKNDRGSGGTGILGAGVATVTADANGAKATRPFDTMWGANEPWWGDVGVTYDPQDGNVYVFGHGPTGLSNYTYLARVPAAKATDVGAYQYWDQAARMWGTVPFSNDGAAGTRKVGTAQAIFGEAQIMQSYAFWSTYYNTWMFVYGAGWPNSDVYAMTAPSLQGPWTKPVDLGTTCPAGVVCGSNRYAVEPHPEYDPTGKTLLVTWTDTANTAIQVERITWR